MPEYNELNHGTKHHDHMHRCNNKMKRIKDLTKNIYVHAILDDWQEEIEQYVMGNIEGAKT